MLCNRFLVAPQFCINSAELAELGELLLSKDRLIWSCLLPVHSGGSAAFLCNQTSSVTGQTGRLWEKANCWTCCQHWIWSWFLASKDGNSRFLVTSSTTVPEPATLGNRQTCCQHWIWSWFLALKDGYRFLCNRQHSGTGNTQEPVIFWTSSPAVCHQQLCVTGNPV